MKRYLADTHALLWFLSAPEKLGRRAARVFESLSGASVVHVSSVTLWEVALLHDGGRIRLSDGFSAWHEGLSALPGVHIEPLTGGDVEAARLLRNLVDPFDRLIAGTALRLDVPLLSRDERIRREPRVRVVW